MIKIELNSYDLEDEFKFMITVSKDLISGERETEDKELLFFAKLLADVLVTKLKTPIAREIEENKYVYHKHG